MKRIGALVQVELLEAKTETCGPLGRRKQLAMSAAISPEHGSGLRPRRRLRRLMARSSFYAMTSGQHAEQRRQSVGDSKPAISDHAAAADR